MAKYMQCREYVDGLCLDNGLVTTRSGGRTVCDGAIPHEEVSACFETEKNCMHRRAENRSICVSVEMEPEERAKLYNTLTLMARVENSARKGG